MMNVRRMPSAPPNSPASNTTLSRGRLAGLGRIRRGPVVLGEHERGEIDLLGELDEPVEGGPPRVERGHPGLDIGDVLQPARDRLDQFGLLARRPEEEARLVHPRFPMTDIAHTLHCGPRGMSPSTRSLTLGCLTVLPRQLPADPVDLLARERIQGQPATDGRIFSGGPRWT